MRKITQVFEVIDEAAFEQAQKYDCFAAIGLRAVASAPGDQLLANEEILVAIEGIRQDVAALKGA